MVTPHKAVVSSEAWQPLEGSFSTGMFNVFVKMELGDFGVRLF